ncbi:LysR family transcriptional regulator [Aquisalimonas sp.]|uniref:LysR family transcriptional regulator n=1 Tax=unclassified Aquisalimonas TaxID=2644645 RepID=UPI0025BFEC57|nr:LysR family transcriptional regulator [Aquisalimonas sp.]
MFLDLRHLRALLAIHENGNLSAAAQTLHITQSALSHQLRSLEDHFDTPLFFRRSRPLRWTPAGQKLLQLAQRIVPEVERAEGELRHTGDGQHGRLHMAVECHSCFEWLMPTLDRYRPDWPGVELDLSMGFSFHPLPALYRGDVDLVITSDPEEDLSGLTYVPLFRYEMLLAVGRQSPLAGRDWITPEDLTDQVLITYPVCPDRLDIFSRFLEPAGLEPAERRTAELTVMLVQLVANGRGVAALPNWALREYQDQASVHARPLGENGLWSTLYAAVRSEDRDKPFIDAFIRLARERTAETLSEIIPAR